MPASRLCACVFVVPAALVAALAVWLVVGAPRSMQHLPVHERVLLHSSMLVFRGLIHAARTFYTAARSYMKAVTRYIKYE